MTVKIGGAIDGDGHIRPPLSLPFPMNDTPAGGLVTMESNTLSEPFYLFQDVPMNCPDQTTLSF
jgi:hypothetical protein